MNEDYMNGANITVTVLCFMVVVVLMLRMDGKITDLEVRINKLQTQLNVHTLHE